MNEFSSSTVELLRRQGLEVDDVRRVVRTALEEDLRYGPDVTTEATVGTTAAVTGSVVSRQVRRPTGWLPASRTVPRCNPVTPC